MFYNTHSPNIARDTKKIINNNLEFDGLIIYI